MRQLFVEEGLNAALNRRLPNRQYVRKLDGVNEAHLIALACSQPPEGQARWTMRLLADRMAEFNYVESLWHETVRQVLKKRTQAVVKEAMVYSTEGKRRACVSDGRCVGCL